MYICLNQINKPMSLRYSKMKDYLLKYRLKTRQKKTLLLNYLRTERQKIIERQRKKLLTRLLFWTPIIGGGFLIYNEIYSKKIEVGKMESKLQRLYRAVMQKETLKEGLSCSTLSPKNIDQLANIVSLAHRYHYKVIVRMDPPSKKQKIQISEQFHTKCLFLDLTALHKQQINPINNTLYVQTGASCQQVNQYLAQNGYTPVFPVEFDTQKVYDVITTNLPLHGQTLSEATVSMELVSASGQNFRSASQTNRYGEIPSLNPLFIGTGGIFALPTAITVKINKLKQEQLAGESLKININDINERVNFLRTLNAINDDFISVQLSNIRENQPSNELYLTCREKYPTNRKSIDVCSALATSKNVAITPLAQQNPQPHNFNLFFSANPSIFESFLLKFGTTLPFHFTNGLLKVHIADTQNSEAFTAVINEITLNNGVLVWCKDKELLMRIKPALDSSQVGAELMHKIVEVRQGLDRRGVLYSHSRYEDYFAKGIFRKLTEFFW